MSEVGELWGRGEEASQGFGDAESSPDHRLVMSFTIDAPSALNSLSEFSDSLTWVCCSCSEPRPVDGLGLHELQVGGYPCGQNWVTR